MSRWVGILCAGGLTACVGAAPALGAPRFSAPITAAARGLPSLSGPPAVAVNASGDSVVAWNTQLRGRAYLRIDARRGGPSGRLGRVQQVGEGSSPEVSIAPDGAAIVMWEGVARPGYGRRLLLASIAPPGMPFGHPQKLLLVKADVPYFSVVATDERIVAVWGQGVPHGRPAIRYAIAADQLFRPDETVGPSYEGVLDGAGTDAAGDVIVSYEAAPAASTEDPHPAAAVLPAGASSFRAPETLAPSLLAQRPYAEPEGKGFADGPGGIAVGLAVEGTGTSAALISTTLGPGLSFSPPVPVSEIPNPPPYLTTYSGPVLALPAEGGQVAAWTVGRWFSGQEESPVTGSLMVSSEQPDGSFSVPVSLSRPATLSQYPVAAATDHTAIVAWGEGEFEREHLVYSVRAADGSFTSPRGLARGVLREPALAAAGTHAVIAWITGAHLQMAVLTG